MLEAVICFYLLVFSFVRSLPLLLNQGGLQRAGTNELERSNLSFYEIDDMMFLTSDRSGQMNPAYRWPKGRIPYAFASGYSYYEMSEIRLAMHYIEEFTCITFHKRQKWDKNYLYIRRVAGKCSSFVGNIRQGPQQLSLDPGTRKCNSPNFPGHVLHELTHAIGFFHEHARDDRNSYVDIRYENLPKGERTQKNYNRNIDNRIESTNFGVPYNYGSIMHYSARAGSINGKETIVRKKQRPNGLPPPLEGTMGQREKLSYGDIKMIQTMYEPECPGSVDLDDIPDSDEIPDLDDWMEDRKLSGATMSDMNVEDVTEPSVGIINETPEDNQIPDPEEYSTDAPTNSSSSVSPTEPNLSTFPSNKTPFAITTTKRLEIKTSTRKIRLTTRRTTPRSTTPLVTKTPNLFNLIQYVFQKYAQSQSG